MATAVTIGLRTVLFAQTSARRRSPWCSSWHPRRVLPPLPPRLPAPLVAELAGPRRLHRRGLAGGWNHRGSPAAPGRAHCRRWLVGLVAGYLQIAWLLLGALGPRGERGRRGPDGAASSTGRRSPPASSSVRARPLPARAARRRSACAASSPVRLPRRGRRHPAPRRAPAACSGSDLRRSRPRPLRRSTRSPTSP